MDLHGNHPPAPSKEIRCADCGHGYLISVGQRSSQCKVCGNIQLHASAPVAELSREILHKNVLPLLAPRPSGAEAPSPLEAFARTPDGARVEEILNKYQIEWQLWAMLVKHFSDPAFHAAYLSHALSDRSLDLATRRYQEHRAVMLLGRDSAWQAEVAELMLARVENLAVMGMQMEGSRRFGVRVPDWVKLLPFDSRVVRIGWALLGMFLVARLFRVF